ncbi:hypothetical protein AOXY_G16372 [Acipenser oxyrinchus oxyrinchus]|uniref:Uncharacterized protein n=1 Tax=Acipenser oxyrinchus oxyrinchus TaxID=40147 RepID=A0AAD8D8D2_ACIOX|nr:hypothetical protein AOXY_G16372 [Acipenser oxyrinchus oxyrinchus]
MTSRRSVLQQTSWFNVNNISFLIAVLNIVHTQRTTADDHSSTSNISKQKSLFSIATPLTPDQSSAEEQPRITCEIS